MDMRTEKYARNEEIYRRRAAGESPTVLAKEYGLTVGRLCGVVTSTAKRLGLPCPGRGQAAGPALPPTLNVAEEVRALLPGTARPRLKPIGDGEWECTDCVVSGRGKTKEGAYQRWLTAATKRAMEAVPAVEAPAPAIEAAPVPAVAPIAWPEPIQLAPAHKSSKPHTRAKSFDVVKKREAAPVAVDVPPEYAGAITVVAGTVAAMRPLTLPTAMRMNAQRAADVQPRLQSMASTSHSVWVE